MPQVTGRGRNPISPSSFSECLWSCVVSTVKSEKCQAKKGRKTWCGKCQRDRILCPILAFQADEHIPQFSLPMWVIFFLHGAPLGCTKYPTTISALHGHLLTHTSCPLLVCPVRSAVLVLLSTSPLLAPNGTQTPFCSPQQAHPLRTWLFPSYSCVSKLPVPGDKRLTGIQKIIFCAV